MRSRQNEIHGIHKWPLLGALALVVLTLVLVTATVLTKPQQSVAANEPVAERLLYFVDSTEGVVAVYDAVTREKLGAFSPGEGAFLRISMRSLMRQRDLKEIDLKLPFKLVRTRNGDLAITDPHSGDNIRVNAFGPVAMDNFARFLPTDYSQKGAEG